MARMGMDVDLVESAAKQLKHQATQINTLVGQIDSIVKGLASNWDGKDASDFVNTWWPEHKKNLAHCATSVDGLGQSALNNATEQRNVSSH